MTKTDTRVKAIQLHKKHLSYFHRLRPKAHPLGDNVRRSFQLRSTSNKTRETLSKSETSQSSYTDRQQLQRHRSRIDQTWIPLVTLSGFSLVAYGVFGCGSESPLLICDRIVHEWILSVVPPDVRDVFFSRTISNLFIEADLVIGVALLIVRIRGHPQRGFVLLGVTALFFYAGAGSHLYEPILVHVLKQYFRRPRPQLLESYAFPSGHVTSAVFLTGAWLFVLLPAALETMIIKEDESIKTTNDRSLVQFLRLIDEDKRLRIVIWGSSFLCTAIGRIGGDVHWVSDTIAACLLGIALTSVFASIHRYLDRQITNRTP